MLDNPVVYGKLRRNYSIWGPLSHLFLSSTPPSTRRLMFCTVYTHLVPMRTVCWLAAAIRWVSWFHVLQADCAWRMRTGQHRHRAARSLARQHVSASCSTTHWIREVMSGPTLVVGGMCVCGGGLTQRPSIKPRTAPGPGVSMHALPVCTHTDRAAPCSNYICSSTTVIHGEVHAWIDSSCGGVASGWQSHAVPA